MLGSIVVLAHPEDGELLTNRDLRAVVFDQLVFVQYLRGVVSANHRYFCKRKTRCQHRLVSCPFLVLGLVRFSVSLGMDISWVGVAGG